LQTFQALGKAAQAGDQAAVLKAYEKLPDALRATAMVTALHIAALGEVGDEAEYARMLERAAARFPAPMFRFSLLDAYHLAGRWDDALRVLDEFMRAVERDAVLLGLRATLELAAGRIEHARRDLREGLALEPQCASVHLYGLEVWLAARDWAGIAASLRFLDGTGKYAFRGTLGGDEAWAEFLRAPESEPWR
jgi:tetratricopeptide (TPR) repeat protein